MEADSESITDFLKDLALRSERGELTEKETVDVESLFIKCLLPLGDRIDSQETLRLLFLGYYVDTMGRFPSGVQLDTLAQVVNGEESN